MLLHLKDGIEARTWKAAVGLVAPSIPILVVVGLGQALVCRILLLGGFCLNFFSCQAQDDPPSCARSWRQAVLSKTKAFVEAVRLAA